jgi:hypothetical protein
VLVVVDDEASLAPLVALSPMLQSATVGFNLVDTGKDREAYEACTAATFPALAACEDDCATDCPEETDCLDACLAGCAPLSDAVRACRNVVDAVVPISSSIPLTLYPSPPEVSTLFTILNQSGTSAADDVDGSQ